MSERIAKKVSKFRENVNSYFFLGFKKKLIKENERGIASLEENCLTEENFVTQIGILGTLVDDFDITVLRSCLREQYRLTGSINFLKRFLAENSLRKGRIIRNLRYIKRIRNTFFPFHHGASGELLRLVSKLGFKFPLDWNNLWKTCLSMYLESLAELQDQLDEFNVRKEYRIGLEKQRIKKLEKEGNVFYLNDILYKYRVLVPTSYKYKRKSLVDYLTASIIAYERSLKSINYALRKYVIPLKDKFREHAEDVYFVERRRFIDNWLFRDYKVLLPRDEIGIRDEKEFQRYYMYVYTTLAADRVGVTPDYLVSHYWGISLA